MPPYAPKRGLRRGFTLIELLIVIGIIAILTTIVIVTNNPTKQLGDARNAQRRVDVNTILNAVHQYSIDNIGNLPSILPLYAREICRSDVNIDCAADGLINLNVLTGAYLVALPIDPKAPVNGVSTKYTILKSDNRITVTAPEAEQGTIISVTR